VSLAEVGIVEIEGAASFMVNESTGIDERVIAHVATLEAPLQLVFRQEEIDTGTLPAKSVLAKTLVSVISPGTELAAYKGVPPLRPGNSYPRVVGYCNVAEVLKVGKGVSDLAIGSRILTFASHRSHFCIDEDQIVGIVPAGMRSGDAACAYLFHLGYNAVLKSEVCLGSTVLVVGLGVLGLTSVAMAALAGGRVFAISDHEIPSQKALGFGAEACFRRSDMGKLAEALGTEKASIVITTSNSWADWRLALESTGNQGTIAVMGFPGRGEPNPEFNPLYSAYFYDRQLRIIAAGLSPQTQDSRGFLPFNEKDNIKRIFGWIQGERINPEILVSGRFPAMRLVDAYEGLVNRHSSPSTYLLDWD
jgi:threonine dehydrogenase-like Zn-dependent dehydrogenase